MTTENTDSTETLVTTSDAPVVKTRKPRSPNKPKTLDKLGVMASNRVTRINDKREKAVAAAIKRLNERFDEQVAEFLNGLPADVKVLVTGLNSDVVVADSDSQAAE